MIGGGAAGFVLAGGRSSRMGRDKAFLELDGEALVVRAARRLEIALAGSGTVAVVGAPQTYGHLGWPVVADIRAPGQGPLAGIEAALASPFAAHWNLVVACDMPFLDPGFLTRLLAAAREHPGPVVTAVSPRGIEPLCAVYRREFGAAASRSLDAGTRAVRDALAGLDVAAVPVPGEFAVANVNTPDEWTAIATRNNGAA